MCSEERLRLVESQDICLVETQDMCCVESEDELGLACRPMAVHREFVVYNWDFLGNELSQDSPKL